MGKHFRTMSRDRAVEKEKKLMYRDTASARFLAFLAYSSSVGGRTNSLRAANRVMGEALFELEIGVR